MSLNGLRRTAVRSLVVAGLLGGAFLAGSPAASASPNCSIIGCSHTHNDSGLGVYTAHNWCWGDDAQRADDQIHQCNNSDQLRWISPGNSTPANEDWDSFRVDAGYCYKGYTSNTYTGSYTNWTINRVSKGGVWVKVSDWQHPHVLSQSTSNC